MPFQPFTYAEIASILRESEGATMDGRHEGHAGRKHVKITNAGLAARLEEPLRRGGGLALFTSFVTFADQCTALLGVLNGADQAAAVDAFYAGRPGAKLEIKNARLAQVTRMRYAIGGTTQTYPCTHYTLAAYKNLSRTRQIHIVTFYGTMGKYYGEP